MAEVDSTAQTHHRRLADAPPGVVAYHELVRAGASGRHPYVVLLGLRSFDTPALVRTLSRGLSFAAFERLRSNMGLSMGELAELVDIRPRTLSRRRERRRLEPDESDRLVRVCRVFALAVELFEGDAGAARSWLEREQTALGGATPFELVRTDVGAREVEALIGRLEHGVFS